MTSLLFIRTSTDSLSPKGLNPAKAIGSIKKMLATS
jgi:hypothetical protein